MAMDRSTIKKAQDELDQLINEGIGLTGEAAAKHKMKVKAKQREVRKLERAMSQDALGDAYGESSAIDIKSEARVRAEQEVKDQSQKDVRDEQVNAMDKLKIDGKSTVRREVDKQGRDKYRDEGTGRYANEEAYQDSENRISMLAGAIKKGATVGPTQLASTKASQYAIAGVSGKVSRNLGDNAGTIQKIIEKEGDQTQNELSKLVSLMEEARGLKGQQGQQAKQKILEQREKLRLTAGESGDDLVNKLGLDDLQKDLNKGSRIKEALNVDQNATGLTALKQAFSPTRLFGDSNTGGLTNFYTDKQNLAIAQKNTSLKMEEASQKEGLADAGKSLSVFSEDKRANRDVSDKTFASGTNKDTEAQTDYQTNVVTLLTDIRDRLDQMSGVSGTPSPQSTPQPEQNTSSSSGGWASFLTGGLAGGAAGFGLSRLFGGNDNTDNTQQPQTTTTATTGAQGRNANILDVIAQGEGTTDERARANGLNSGYDVTYGYGQYAQPSKPLSEMTLAEVRDFQREQVNATRGQIPGTSQGTGAVGRYQFTQGTLAELTEGMDENTVFSKELQDQLGSRMVDQRRSAAGGDPEKFADQLAMGWASLPTASGAGYYGGQNAHVSRDTVMSAINNPDRQLSEAATRLSESADALTTASAGAAGAVQQPTSGNTASSGFGVGDAAMAAGTAGMGSRLMGKVPGGQRVMDAGGSLMEKVGLGGGGGASRATKAGGGLMSKLGKGAKFLGRAAGKLALPLAGAMAVYDGYKGFTADENASFTDKLKNAGSSVLSGLTFGLAGTSADDIAANAGGGGGGQMKPEGEGEGEDPSAKEGTEGKAVKASSADTGEGYQPLDPDGNPVNDAQGRPAIFSKEGAEAFSEMMVESKGQVKGTDIASSKRSVEKNRAVGGASKSKHMSGLAMDIHGSSNSWIRANGSKYGWKAHDYRGSHGGHFIFGKGSGLPMPADSGGSPRGGGGSSYGGGGGSAAPSRRSSPSPTQMAASTPSPAPTTQGNIARPSAPELPTGAAVDNMTQMAANDVGAPAPVVNNITNNNGGASDGGQLPSVIPGSRPSAKSTIERYLDRRFYG